jgi:hypothetical protein
LRRDCFLAALHEEAHAAVARHYHREVRSLGVYRTGRDLQEHKAWAGHIEVDLGRRPYVRRRIGIAGALAEAFERGEGTDEVDLGYELTTASESDVRMAGDWNYLDQERVTEILQRHWGEILRVANLMAETADSTEVAPTGLEEVDPSDLLEDDEDENAGAPEN